MAPTSFSPEWLERANYLALIARQLSTTIHDVNNILQVIGGHAELLQRGPGANEVSMRRGETISTQALRATSLLAELGAFARDLGDRIETVGLRDTAQRALAMRSQALSRLKVSSVLQGDELRVHGNPRRLLQIVLNLVVNAEQALTGAPLPQLRLAVALVGNRAQLTVDENGVTNPTTPQAPRPDGQSVPSLGIGFSVSQWLAGEHNGTLERVPLPRGGSRATLSLPVA